MTSFEWESFLQQWSQEILESMKEDQLAQLPQEAIASCWLGYPGATEQQICQVESRLGVRLPPSYREFLKVTNGWRQTTSFIRRLWSTEGIERFALRHQKWIDAFTNHHESTQVSFEHAIELDELWEPPTIADEEYFDYGKDQDCSKLRVEYLKTAIEISDVGESSIYLLNPQVVTEDGEWEAWFFGDWLPGADRYRSFREMMEAEYQNFLELRDPTLEQNGVAIKSELIDETEAFVSVDLTPTQEAESFQPATSTEFEEPLPEQEPWKVLKRFTIAFQSRKIGDRAEYQTLVTSEDAQQQQSWSGLADPKLRQWLRQQIADSIVAKYVPAPESPEPLADSTPQKPATLSKAAYVQLEIDQLIVRQDARPKAYIVVSPAKLKESGSMVVDSLMSHEPFSIEVAFRLVGQPELQFTSHPITYKAVFYAQSRITGKHYALGETKPQTWIEGQATYSAILEDTMLEPGIYRLQALATLKGIQANHAFLEMPLVQVM